MPLKATLIFGAGQRQLSALRVALVGYAWRSMFHAPFIAADQRLDLAVVVTANPIVARRSLARYPDTA